MYKATFPIFREEKGFAGNVYYYSNRLEDLPSKLNFFNVLFSQFFQKHLHYIGNLFSKENEQQQKRIRFPV